MQVPFRLPSLGADMESATLTQWLKQPGESIRRGEPIATVETTKGLIDIESYEDGVLTELVSLPGAKVPVGAVLAHLEVDAAHSASASGAAESGAPPIGAPPASAPAPGSAPAPVVAAQPQRLRLSPAARRRAQQLGLAPETLRQTATPGGVLSLADIEQLDRAQPAHGAAEHTAMRQTIGAAMARSKREIPHYYLGHTLDFGPAQAWLAAHNAPLPVGERLLDSLLIIKAVALAAARSEGFNGYFRDGRFEPSAAVHVGAAIALRGGGLLAPALPDAHAKDLPTLMREFSALVMRARAGHLRSGEFTAATITVTNLGADGVDVLYPIINPPQVAIIGVGAIRASPWALEGQLLIRPTLTLGLAADHRVTDGRAGARFLRAIAALLGEPAAL